MTEGGTQEWRNVASMNTIFRTYLDIAMAKLPVKMLLRIFKLLLYEDLKIVVLVCRRWREIGETPRL